MTKTITNKLIYTDFLNQAQLFPHKLALVVNEKNYTYADLLYNAKLWSSCLLQLIGYKRLKRVGIFAYKSATSYIGVLASLFTGAAFVPLNKNFPLERTKNMILAADLDAIIVDEHSFSQLIDLLPQLDDKLRVLAPKNDKANSAINVDGIIFADEIIKIQTLINPVIVPDNEFAYILFTSGSTGIPKGVPITHKNACAFLKYNLQRYQLTPEDRLSQTFDQTFDLSIFDLFMAWSSGASLHAMQPIDLLAPSVFIKKHAITVWFSVPSLIDLLRKKELLKKNSLPTLRWSLFCGEKLSQVSAEAWQKAASNSVVENLYGPTELTIACSVYRWNPLVSGSECSNGIVPIGEIYDHLSFKIVDENLCKVKLNYVGELCISGSQMFEG